MTNFAVGIVLIAAGFICIGQWHRGVLICVVVGLLQDPLRKMLPGQPLQVTALVAVFVALTIGDTAPHRRAR